jgi:hypothetical protein
MTRHPARLRVPVAALVALLAALLGGAALAHATLVFGTVTTEPAPPPAGEPFALWIEMRDPVDAPVEDAIVFVEARPEEGGEMIASDRFAEPEGGVYRTELVLPEPGPWTLLFRDQTYRQEEAQATVTLAVGPDAVTEQVSFIFPPTATGPTNLATWLVWLVGLPLVAGAVVTVIVLRSGRPEGGDHGEDGAERPAT